MSFIPTLKYTKTLMLGETYDFGSIQAELSGFEIDSIEATWLNNQSPKEMGYHPVQVKVVATTGEIFETTIQVFVYTKPYDGHRKFMIFTYQDTVKMLTFDCPNIPTIGLYYTAKSNCRLAERNIVNGYVGNLGYVFDADKKEWLYERTLVGRHHYKMTNEPSVDYNGVLYSNLNIYDTNKSTILYEADEMKENLPYWSPACQYRINYNYPSVLEAFPKAEAYYVTYNRLSNLTLMAYCFTGLNGSDMTINYKAYGNTYAPNITYTPVAGVRCTILTLDVKDPNAQWQVSFYNGTTLSGLPSLGVFNDATFGWSEVMNTLHEVYNVNFNVMDKDESNGYLFVDHKKAVAAPTESVREAKYRMKNDVTGEYDTIHFETNFDMVSQLPEKFEELTQSLADQYNKVETIQMFDATHEGINDVELMTNALNDRLIAVNKEQEQVAFDLTNEVVRATEAEGRLQSQLNNLSDTLSVLPADLLNQANTYTDEQVAKAQSSLDELEGQLGSQSSDLVTRLDEVAKEVEGHHESFFESSTELNTQLDGVDGRVSALETSVTELVAKDVELDGEIAKLKQHLLNKGNDTLVFATQAQFEQATLTPKDGDLVYILETKKAFIYSNGSFILFDEITTTEDLTAYILKSDVAESMTSVENLLNTEVERATTEEGQLASHLQGVADIDTLQGQTIHTLEQTTTEHQSSIDDLGESRYTQAEVEALIDSELEKQMAVMSIEEPSFGRVGHVWLEEMID